MLLGLVIDFEDRLLELFIGEPEADVPGNQPGEGGVEALVEGKETLILPGLDGALHRATILSIRAVHEPGNKKIKYIWSKTLKCNIFYLLPITALKKVSTRHEVLIYSFLYFCSMTPY